MVFGHVMQGIFTDSLLQKNLPKDIRGSMLGVYQFAGTIGVMVFTKVAALLSERFGPASPFLFVGALDVAFVCFIVLLIISKKFDL